MSRVEKIFWYVIFFAVLQGVWSTVHAQSRQYGWQSVGGGGPIKSGAALTCESFKIVYGTSLSNKCWFPDGYMGATYGSGVFPEDFGQIPVGTRISIYNNTYGYPSNGSSDMVYVGPQPDKCPAPRYEGPDTTKPLGSQCTRVACVAGDVSPGGIFEEPIRYFTTSTNATLQSFGSPGTVQMCIDGCIAKPSSNSGNCPSRVYSGDVSYQYCKQAFADTATKCAVNDEPPKQPAFVPPVVTPPDPDPEPPGESCGVPGKPACPDPTQPPPSTCGQPGQPACYPGGTCGALGQPACTGGGNGSGPGGTSAPGSSPGSTTPPPPVAPPPSPTCGVEGKPACSTDATCGGVGQPACGYGDGSGSPGNAGSCGGLNQPACQIQVNSQQNITVSGEGVPTGAGMQGDLSGVEGLNKAGNDAIGGITAESVGLFDWFPRIPTLACANPQVPNPVNGDMKEVPICGPINIFSKLVSAVISVLCIFGMVTQIQIAIRA